MPRCKRCGENHFNFAACPEPAKPAAVGRMNTAFAPPGFHVVTQPGQRWGNAPAPGVTEKQFQHPMRVRTGTLTYPPAKEGA